MLINNQSARSFVLVGPEILGGMAQNSLPIDELAFLRIEGEYIP